MSKDVRVLGYQILSNQEVELHSHQEIKTLVKARVLTSDDLTYNDQLRNTMEKHFWEKSQKNEGPSRQRRLLKELGKVGQLGEADRMMIINNKCRTEAELRLKVPSIQNLSAKQLKAIIQIIK